MTDPETLEIIIKVLKAQQTRTDKHKLSTRQKAEDLERIKEVENQLKQIPCKQEQNSETTE